MNAKTHNDVRTSDEEMKKHKNIQKVLFALENDPFGLSVAQIANNTRLSVKTVQNVLATQLHLVEENIGVYSMKAVPAEAPSQPEMPDSPETIAVTADDITSTEIEHSPSSEEALIQHMDSIETAAQLPDPLASYKAMVETVVVQKKSVNLNMRQLTELLQDVFGLKKVCFLAEGLAVGRVSVQLSDEVEV